MQNIPMVYPPLAHQAEEYQASKDAKIRALFWDMGLGKSKTIIDTMIYLWLNEKIDTAIVIAKKGEYSNWKYVELPEHMPAEIPYTCELYRSGMKEHEKQKIRDLGKPNGTLRILVVNVESMTFEGGKVAKWFATTKKQGLMIVVDESTCVKTHKNARSKIVYSIADKADYKRIMTGTAITRSPMDIFGQSLVLGKGTLGHTSFFSFKGEFAIEEKKFFGARSFNAIVGYKNLNKLTAKINQIGSVKTKDECLDLPPKIYQKVVVELTDQQQELYESMRDMAIAEFPDGQVVEAVNALSIISKLDQIACGQLKNEDGTFRILDSNRPEALLTRLEITSKKGIIWCNYRGLLEHLYNTMLEEFGPEKVGRYYGGVPDDEREDVVRRFQDEDDQLQWIVANQQSLGYGRTLTRGKQNFYYSNGYNLEHRLQSEDRTMRIGQDESVDYTDFYSRGTVNERIMHLLRTKKTLAHEVLGTRITDWI